ncbi:hypothetical protein [Ornithinimicrobium sufpigmenti]|uniref:hypothetical protein n=1 Tax=Ornithinimicrobium sufpigmenti TaxID=2508882 RepID=UPI001035912D|nr:MULTISPECIES: hypothetical protein [unclassified Ornithinimicrobium]
MTALVPAPGQLGLEAPLLGPWFSTDLTLPVPSSDDLGVTLTIPDGTSWLPPATGLLSFAVAGTTPLAGMRGPAGTPPFQDGRYVATFRLLPEVEARLGALLADVPAADGSSTGVTRAVVRTFALELPGDPGSLSSLEDRLVPPLPGSMSDEEKRRYLGLEGTPIADLKRPGTFLGGTDAVLDFDTEATVRLFAFDARGRAIDPGAVAAWWARLATSFTNLWASGADERTATVDAQRTVILCGPDESPAAEGVLARLSATGMTGAGAVRVAGSETATVALTAGGQADAALPRVAVLPRGTYGPSASLWAGGSAVGGVTRDCVRIALVDVEEHLTGQRRAAPSGASDAVTRRAADQARASTSTLVARATVEAADTVLLASADAAMASIVAAIDAGPATVLAPVLDRGAGALTAPSLPTDPPPASITGVTATPLTGGGTADGGVVLGQRILVTVPTGPALAGAWVRVWPQYFDPTKGRHLRGAGGGGLVDAAGNARVVVRLADGAVAPNNRMGLDIMVVTAAATTRYPEVRLERPAPVGGAMVALGSAGGSVLVCETGTELTGPVAAGSVPSGSTLVALATPPSLVDPTSIPASAWAAPAVGQALGAGDTVVLTEPAWRGWRGGETDAALAGTGASVRALARTLLLRPPVVASPLPTQARDEVVAVALSSGVAEATVAGVRPLGTHHELGTHQAGHPGAPADDERHGTAARLRGPAVVAVAELARERTSPETPALALASATPLPAPAAPTIAGSWAATLRTVAARVECEPGVVEVMDTLGLGDFPWEQPLADLRTWLVGQGIPVPDVVDQAATSMQRALNRRMLGARWGYRETATALAARLAGAQDFVYLETPALDALPLGSGDDELDVMGSLTARLAANPALHVLVCVPMRLPPGAPSKLGRVRNAGVMAGLAALRQAGGHRVAAFTPVTGPGRSLHLDATSVVVDDAWALTGGTHLWRRGLSFDTSLAVAVFDERLDRGRPSEVVAFRRALIAGRLGLAPTLLPEDPEQLVRAVRTLSTRGGGVRLTPEVLEAPSPEPTELDTMVWNPDGSFVGGFNFMAWLAGLAAGIQAEIAEAVPGEA